jgi:surface protein
VGHCGGDDHAIKYVHSHPLVSVVASLEFCPLTPVAFVFYVFSILFLDCVHPRHRHPPTAFYGASKFNADLSKWNTAAVTSMASSTLTPSLFLLSLVSFHWILFTHPPLLPFTFHVTFILLQRSILLLNSTRIFRSGALLM